MLRIITIIVLLGLVIIIFVPIFLRDKSTSSSNMIKEKPNEVVLAYYSYSNGTEAQKSLMQNNQSINIISPSWYRYERDGSIKGKGYDKVLVNRLDRKRIKLLPLLTNNEPSINGGSEELASSIMGNKDTEDVAITNAIKLLKQDSLDGFNLDFEGIGVENRQKFVEFVKKLAIPIHNEGKLLYISLPAKYQDTVNNAWVDAFDYQQLGSICDAVVVMTYNESWSTSQPGPIASPEYIKKVLQYTTQTIKQDKVIMGLPVYGIDWEINGKEPGKIVSFSYIATIKNQDKNLTSLYQNGTNRLVYTNNGEKHEIWYENEKSFSQKLNLIRNYKLLGIGIWSLGKEDANIWKWIN